MRDLHHLVLLLAVTLRVGGGYLLPSATKPRHHGPSFCSSPSASRIFITSLGSSASGDDEVPKDSRGSRLDGNMREPTAEEIAIMDEMITKLADSKPYELPNAVRRAFRVISSPRFFMRIAERSDGAANDTEREKLSALAANLANTLEVVVETTKEQLDERSTDVENVVKAAAEPDSGEFLVPLLPERVEAMRQALEQIEEASLDEGFLSTVDAWMNKSNQDGMDLMVSILQKVLQMYAGTQILRVRASQATDAKPTAEAELFDELLGTDTESWDGKIRKNSSEATAPLLIKEVQKTMESVVLGLENGSMAQQIQAEYLRELVARIEVVQA